jgi:uncharacterized protein YndB with AHSA1/START domain
MTDSLSLQVERVVPGPIEAVFDAWLDADSLKHWMTPGPGMTVPEATTEARVGGRFHIVMRHQGRDIPHDGEYQVIERPRKLVFTWISEPAGNTLVTIDFQRVSDTETKVVLTHEQHRTVSARDSHQQGWTGILDALATAMA